MPDFCRSRSDLLPSFVCAGLILAIAVSRASLPAMGVLVLGMALVAAGKGRAP